MSHKYKQRTLDEAVELAQSVFKTVAVEFLSPKEMEEMANFGTIMMGHISDCWEQHLGYAPEKNKYYEIELYKPLGEYPYVEKIYARILVTRNHSSEQVEILWKPEIPA